MNNSFPKEVVCIKHHSLWIETFTGKRSNGPKKDQVYTALRLEEFNNKGYYEIKGFSGKCYSVDAFIDLDDINITEVIEVLETLPLEYA